MPELNLAAGLLLKPLVLLLTGWCLFRLWPRRRTPAVRLVLWAFAAFGAAELFCAADVYLGGRMSLPGEAGHDVLTALAAGLFIVGIYDFARGSYRCWNRDCGSYRTCDKLAAECHVAERLGPMPKWLFLGGALLAALPLSAAAGVQSLRLPVGWGSRVFGHYGYERTLAIAALEQRWLAVAAAVILLTAAARYAWKQRLDAPGLWLAALGAGTLGFVFFRVVLVHLFFPDATLAGFWEEVLEFLSLVLFLIWWHRARQTEVVSR